MNFISKAFRFCTNIVHSGSQLRLSKYLSNTGVCSRREAERLIQAGMVQVNNRTIDQNMLVTPEMKIKVFTRHGTKVPVAQSTRVWVMYKPVGMICSHDDPARRQSVYQYAQNILKTDAHLISVGRLDYNSEGLLILTNDGRLARVLELPKSHLSRTYRVRVYGTVDETKLTKIRTGMTIAGKQYGPFQCTLEHRQTRNTWLKLTLTTGKNREIRKVMQKLSLRVNRLIRVQYGPYTLRGLRPGDIYETIVEPVITKKVYEYIRDQVKAKEQERLSQSQIQKDIKLLEKNQNNKIGKDQTLYLK